MENCIFCRIVRRELPASKIFENDKVLAFLDINPISRGHTLVIPKEHYLDITDIPEEILKEIIAVTQNISKKIFEKLGADGINLQNSNKPAANQVVPHYHMHIIPRYNGDGIHIMHGVQQGEKKDFEKIMKELIE